jgi:hypothetical protein
MLRGHLDVITPDRLAGWCIDDRVPDRPVEVVIFAGGKKIAIGHNRLPRPDVEKALGQSGNFGFLIEIGELNLDGQLIEVRFSETNELLDNGRRYLISTNNIVRGKTGYFFERNHEEITLLDNLCGKVELSSVEINTLVRSLEMRHSYIKGICPNFQTFVSPDKAVCYPQFLPDGVTISQRRPGSEISSRTGSILYLDAVRELAQATSVFHKNDTHLNDRGVLIVYHLIRTFLAGAGTNLPPLPKFSLAKSSQNGDLSHPDLGNMGEEIELVQFPKMSQEIVKNGILGYGCVRVYRSGVPGPRVLLFGTSTGLQLARFLAWSCSELVFVFNHDVSYELVMSYMADLVLTVIPERVLTRAPSPAGIGPIKIPE